MTNEAPPQADESFLLPNDLLLTSPIKVLSGNLERIVKLRYIDGNTLCPMALRGQDRRFTHKLRPINVDGCSILSVMSSKDSPNISGRSTNAFNSCRYRT